MIWDGNVAWSDMARHDDCKLYINVWTERKTQRDWLDQKRYHTIPDSYDHWHYISDPIIPFEG